MKMFFLTNVLQRIQMSLFAMTLTLIGLMLCVGCSESSPRPSKWTLTSPSGSLEITVEQLDLSGTADFPAGQGLYYTVRSNGEAVLEHSSLGIETDKQSFITGLRFVQSTERTIQGDYTMLVGKRSKRAVLGHELILRFQNQESRKFEVILRAHNDGIAFRYRLLGDGKVIVNREATGFAPLSDSVAFMTPYDGGGVLFFGTYEQVPQEVTVGDSTNSTGWAFPALFEIKNTDTWVLLSEADLDHNYCGTRLHQEPVENLYRIRFPEEAEGNKIGDVFPEAELPFNTPWRVAIVGDLATIVESTLVDDLSRPAELSDIDWIKPGRVAWSWFSQWTGNESLQREYIQFASEMDWEHILIDEGWDRWSDVATVMPKLVADAAAQGVGVILWYNSGGQHTINMGTPRDLMLDPAIRLKEMERLAEWGVAGIKVDFFESDKQDRIQQYLGILEDAGNTGLMVNLHGATIPRGWQRTYPNLMTHEAVRGAEYYKYPVHGPGPRENVINAFLRNLIGSMDYTPIVFETALEEVDSTYAHQLALSVIFESGWQHFADRADSNPGEGYRAVFSAFSFVEDFLKKVPTTWDDTRFLSGDPRSHIILARRSGSIWYIAGINGGDEDEKVTIPLSFLESGSYEMHIIRSGISPDDFDEEVKNMTVADIFEFVVGVNDGFVVSFTLTN